jgi:hypothetical protein
MSERIRNIREALRSGFDTQIAIGEKAFGLAEQRESRNFQMALEARRERLQRELQTEQIQSREGIAARSITAQAEAEEKRQAFQIKLQDDQQEFSNEQTERQREYQKEVLQEQREYDQTLLADERLYNEGILDKEIARQDRLLKEQIERETKSAQAKLRAETLVDTLTEIRTQMSTLLKDMQTADDETIGLYQSELRDLAKQRSAIEDSLAEMNLFVKTEFEIIDIGKNAFDKFFKSSPISQEDLIGLAQDYVDKGAVPGEGEKIRKEINNWLKGQGIDYKDETQDQYVERFIRTLALYKDAESGAEAPPTDGTTAVPDLNAQTTGRVDPRSGDPVVFVPRLAQSLFPGIFGSPDRSGLDPSKIPQPMNIVMGWQKSGYTNAQIQGMLKQMIETQSLPEEQLPLWNELLRIFTIVNEQSGQQTGMMNPQGGLLSQQPMMAMQSDMTQGEIDYFSPDAINARLSGMV